MKTRQLPALITGVFFVIVLTFGLVYARPDTHTGSLYFALAAAVALIVWQLRTWRIRANDNGSFTLSRMIGMRSYTLYPSEIRRIEVSYSKSMKTSETTTILTLETADRKFNLSSVNYKDFDEVVTTALRGRSDLLQSYHRQLRREKKKENSLQRQLVWLLIAIAVAILLFEFIVNT